MIKFDNDEFLKPQIYSTNDEYETRCNVTKEIVDDIKQLQQENQELKKQLEEYKATNKVLSQELTKDKVLQQDHLTTCCGIPIGDIPKLITQQKEFIEYLEKTIEELECEDFDDEEYKTSEAQRKAGN